MLIIFLWIRFWIWNRYDLDLVNCLAKDKTINAVAFSNVEFKADFLASTWILLFSCTRHIHGLPSRSPFTLLPILSPFIVLIWERKSTGMESGLTLEMLVCARPESFSQRNGQNGSSSLSGSSQKLSALQPSVLHSEGTSTSPKRSPLKRSKSS